MDRGGNADLTFHIQYLLECSPDFLSAAFGIQSVYVLAKGQQIVDDRLVRRIYGEKKEPLYRRFFIICQN